MNMKTLLLLLSALATPAYAVLQCTPCLGTCATNQPVGQVAFSNGTVLTGDAGLTYVNGVLYVGDPAAAVCSATPNGVVVDGTQGLVQAQDIYGQNILVMNGTIAGYAECSDSPSWTLGTMPNGAGGSVGYLDLCDGTNGENCVRFANAGSMTHQILFMYGQLQLKTALVIGEGASPETDLKPGMLWPKSTNIQPTCTSSLKGLLYNDASMDALCRCDGVNWHRVSDPTAIGTTPDSCDGAPVNLWQPLDGDLTAIAALATNGVAGRTGSNTWVILSTTGTGNVVMSASPTFTGVAEFAGLGLSGIISPYAGFTADASHHGMPYTIARAEGTGITADISATTIATSVPKGRYHLCATIDITTADAVSSTLPAMQALWTSPTDSVVKTTPISTTSAGNTTGTSVGGCVIVNAKDATNIQFNSTGYASNTPNVMTYEAYLTLEVF